jgi:hypothetical protein
MAINVNIPKPTYTTAEVTDSVDARYVTDAELTVIQNTSNTNTGDQDLSGLVPYTGATGSVDLNTNDLIFGAGAGILLDNTSRLREGTIDAGTGGTKGIAQICAVGYELKWEAGSQYVMDGNGVLVRIVNYKFNIAPTVDNDDTEGFYVGSRWILDDGTIYTCSDSTTGAAVWDLNSGFVPYTGATQDVDLGEYELKAGQIELDQTPTGTAGVAVMRWNDTDGTVDLGLKGGNVNLQIGQEQVVRVVNKTATNINLLEANYQAVRVTGAQGQRLKVDLAQATNDALSAETIGLVTETINNNQEGFITTSGLVRGINTTGSLQSETWADGDIVYLSATTAGRITNVKPSAPNHLVIIGYVVSAHATQGSIFVKVDNGYELDELHNVAISTPLNNQSLVYETSTTLWKNKALTTAEVADSTNKRYVTDANLTVIGNTSGTNTGDQTFLNARVQTVSSSATVTATSTNDIVTITAQAVGLTLANPTGTFTEGQSLIIRVKDNGTARTIAYGANFRAIGVTAPTTTVINKTTYIGCIFNSTDTKFDIIGTCTEA